MPSPNVLDSDSQDARTERLSLIKTANRLTISFAAWALVVGIVGTISLVVINRIWNEQISHEIQGRQIEAELRREIYALENQQVLIKERQDAVLRRLDRLEDDKREGR